MNQKNILFIAGMAIPVIIMVIGLTIWQPRKKEQTPTPTKSLMEMEPYRNIDIAEVKSIEKRRYTEGGMQEELIENPDEISNTMYYLYNMQLGEETNQACEDNTTIYILNIQDGKQVKIEIECDWVIIDKKRYLIVK